ncbi:Xanthine and CO dehydrogenases maturation factor, XdhC/CoxF family [Arthrobacter sp. 9AX]|uniref:XdhC family protein n=1 Tax=Arthrobacter sp. 9AX TaxID=2653131 RepID=UPI0012F3CFA5|nr:XdhC/CoxI family protein [Arthrobacter sp. 9AX]VXC06375.1 Xanthine and CO dehydrogenases maturation factor, XdhC/CoxF family [Arthrobacter sp. 9AX]
MLDLIPTLGSWAPALTRRPFAVATIVRASGSVPRPVGTSMLVSSDGLVLGSLSGGCVEGAVVAAALDAMDDGVTRLETFGFSAEDAFAAGLTCGGELDVHIEPANLHRGCRLGEAVLQLAACGPDQPVALVRTLTPHADGRGSNAVVIADPGSAQPNGDPALATLLDPGADAGGARAAQLESFLRSGTTGVLNAAGAGLCAGGADILVESRLAPPRLLVFGANDFSAPLLPAAKPLGYHVTLVDARQAFASQSRFTAADEVVTAWPHTYLAAEAAAGRVDSRTVICVLTHDPKFDIPLLDTALCLDVAFIGALGSRRSHAQRVDALLDRGVRPERIAQLHSPLGLDIGAVTPAEVAVSVLAEIIAARKAVSHQPLRETSGPIHSGSLHQLAAPAAPTTLLQQEIAWT